MNFLLQVGSTFSTHWITVIEILLLRTVRDELINTETEYANTINLFGNLLLNCELLEENADELMRRCFDKILNRKDPVEIMWMNKVLQKMQRFQK